MGKRFRLSTEVHATLQCKHDRWTPYCAYSRVEKELSAFRALCEIIISFFQMPVATTENDEVGCNGRAVKMFADLIKRSLRDEDFVARKCMMFNVVLFFYYRIRFLLMVRFVNVYFFSFFCYRRLYVGYWVAFGRRDVTVGVRGDSARIRGGKPIGCQSVSGGGHNMLQHDKCQSGCHGFGFGIFTQ